MIGNPNNLRREEFRARQAEKVEPRFPTRSRFVILEDGSVVKAEQPVSGTVLA